MELAEKQQPEEASLRCPICGTQLVAGKCTQCKQQQVYPLVRHEIWVLVLVAVATIPLYLFTREAAFESRARKTRTATYWFERGQEQLRAGDADGAIAWFHRATMNDRGNFEYGLALANALAVGGYSDEAQLSLLSLRDSAPEDSRINLQLARLVAKRDDLNGAVHYYRNALYGVWPNGDGDRQRRLARMELIHFLLDRVENTRGCPS